MAKAYLSKVGTAVVVVLAPATAHAASTYYVAPSGNDSAAGTMTAPFASWARAQTAVTAGDTVYFRAGTYKYSDATSTCTSTSATVNAVVLNKSGTSASPISYFAYPGETPIFDFSGITDTSKYNCRQVGVRVEADWLHLKGLELTGTLQLNDLNHESWCVYLTGGSNNTFEQLNAHHNMGPGFFIQAGGHNTFLNCDSHENEDKLTSNGDGQSADGFGCHPNRAGDTGNVFRGCRAWWNSDDNWDFISSKEVCTVEYSWAWYAGYKPDTLANGAPVSLAAGNGNGIKAGGYGDPQTAVPTPTPQHVVRFNVSFYNKVNGFYANHEIVSPFFYNNTSFNNGNDYDMLGLNGTTVTSVGTLRNNLAYSPNGRPLTVNMGNGGPISDQFNSWDANLNLKLVDTDFQSVAFKPAAACPPTDTTCFAGMASARQADGSLPVLPFLRLAANSQLIDKGTDVGLPFVGKAPDLGAFEYGAAVASGGAGGSAAGGVSGVAGADAGGSGAGPASGGVAPTGGAATVGGSTSAGANAGIGAATNANGGGDPIANGGDSAMAGNSPTSGASSTGSAGSAGKASTADASGCSCRVAAPVGKREGVGAAFSLLALGAACLRRRKAER